MLQIPKKNEQVNYSDLAQDLEKAGPAIVEYFGRKGLRAVVTSANDGSHSRHSAHYLGRALDLRTWGVKSRAPFCIGLQKALAPLSTSGNFFVVWESDHIHLEWCPKNELPNIVGYKEGRYFYDSVAGENKS